MLLHQRMHIAIVMKRRGGERRKLWNISLRIQWTRKILHLMQTNHAAIIISISVTAISISDLHPQFALTWLEDLSYIRSTLSQEIFNVASHRYIGTRREPPSARKRNYIDVRFYSKKERRSFFVRSYRLPILFGSSQKTTTFDRDIDIAGNVKKLHKDRKWDE